MDAVSTFTFTTGPGGPADLIALPVAVATDDPAPLEPERPLPMECCDSGCETCVHDVYADEMQHYRKLLAAWKARHPAREPG